MINATEAWKTIAQKIYLRVLMLFDSQALDDLSAILFATTPTENVFSIATGGDKKSHTFQDGTKQFILKTEATKASDLTYSFDEIKYDAGNRLSLSQGEQLKIVHVNLTGRTIYFTAAKSNLKIEILEWK